MGRLRAAGIAGYNLGASCQVKEGHGGQGAGEKAQPWGKGRADLPLRDSNSVFCPFLARIPLRALAQTGY